LIDVVTVVVNVAADRATARRGGCEPEAMATLARASAINLTRSAARCSGVSDATGFPGCGAIEAQRKSRHPRGVLVGLFRRRGVAEAPSERVG